jgi:hypothetical protein
MRMYKGVMVLVIGLALIYRLNLYNVGLPILSFDFFFSVILGYTKGRVNVKYLYKNG